MSAEKQAAAEQAVKDFLDASIAVWREIDRLMTIGPYPGIPMAADLRLTEKLAWERFKPFAGSYSVPAQSELFLLLREAIELIQEDIDNRDGRDNFGMCCGNCDGALPIKHSFGCRAKQALAHAEARL